MERSCSSHGGQSGEAVGVAERAGRVVRRVCGVCRRLRDRLLRAQLGQLPPAASHGTVAELYRARGLCVLGQRHGQDTR